VLTLLIFRLLWGFVGSSTARFASFVRGPKAVSSYLRGSWQGIGHNPLGALSVLALLGATAVQVGLGLIAEDEDGIVTGPLYKLVSVETSDWARELHESWFYVLLALIVLHLAAIVFYHVRGRRLLPAMISGRSDVDAKLPVMRPGKWWVAVVSLLIAIGITRWVIAGAPPFGG
jgi:cytochrome b